MQSKKESLKETITDVTIGYLFALMTQIIIFPWFGIYVSLGKNIKMGLCFTVVAIIRKYCVRRWFNKKSMRSLFNKKKVQL